METPGPELSWGSPACTGRSLHPLGSVLARQRTEPGVTARTPPAILARARALLRGGDLRRSGQEVVFRAADEGEMDHHDEREQGGPDRYHLAGLTTSQIFQSFAGS